MHVLDYMISDKTAPLFVQIYVAFLLAGFFLVPAVAEGARLEVAAWVPWWSEKAGAEDALDNIDELDVVYPFVIEVNSDGSLRNRVNFRDNHWDDLFDKVNDEQFAVIPTVAWFDGEAIHSVLSDKDARQRHIKEITSLVKKYRFDGINIDYEAKLSETVDYFSLFLKELKRALERKDLTCTIEARMPPESRWRTVPTDIKYANDYQAMNKYCDWVEIMAYDQQRADIILNDERRGVPYVPVADIDWVKKVLDLAVKDIDTNKIMLGLATYGRAWDVTVASEWYRDYDQVASLNHQRILELADKYNAPIGRTKGGEAVISYFPDTSPWRLLDKLPAPKGTPKGYEAAAKALLVATYADIEIPVRVVTWSDARAVRSKVRLARDYDLKGVAIFKIDGEEDVNIWKTF